GALEAQRLSPVSMVCRTNSVSGSSAIARRVDSGRRFDGCPTISTPSRPVSSRGLNACPVRISRAIESLSLAARSSDPTMSLLRISLSRYGLASSRQTRRLTQATGLARFVAGPAASPREGPPPCPGRQVGRSVGSVLDAMSILRGGVAESTHKKNTLRTARGDKRRVGDQANSKLHAACVE